MKYNVKLALFGLLFLGVAALQAQDPVTMDSTITRVSSRVVAKDTFPRSSYQTATMTEKLSLTEAQRNKVNDINMRYEDRQRIMLDSFRGNNRDRTAYRNNMTTLRQKQDSELKSVLTADQWTAWEKWQAEQKPMNKGDRKDHKDHKDHKQEQSPMPPANDKMNKSDRENKPSKPSQTSPPGGGG